MFKPSSSLRSPFQVHGQGLWQFLQHESSQFLFPHQEESLKYTELWFQDRQLQDKRCMIVVPTGGGKSAIAVLIPYVLGSKKCLIVTPSLILKMQMKKDIRGDTSIEQSFLIRSGIVSKDEAEQHGMLPSTLLAESSNDLRDVAGTYHTVITNAQKFRSGDKADWVTTLPLHLFDLLIVDEAHHFPAEFWNNIVAQCQEKRIRVIFLSASPYRSDGAEVLDTTFQMPTSGVFYDTFKMHRFPFYHLPLQEAVNRRIIRPMAKVEITDTQLFEPISNDTTLTDKDKSRHCAWILTISRMKEQIDRNNANYPFSNGKKHCGLILASNQQEADQIHAYAKQIYPTMDIETYHTGNTLSRAVLEH